eukprot:CAMPEP_0201527474 /NCGR_PEP_ID=MMETSP0161_2-20130828/35280_1 /ASSEMBLY_ACC=CAM_ASM_000251 /TAXON_ID=180227 /ORGANISM="Neoparamoeba aestuarina, Strain SoJaBio B1-5/56/2" /LENGTH=268 /DNA_ID=CAMNT_0047928321 /DNA_START=116 /DNA_END=919 /DNA_ORIENTATION=-
MGLTPPSDLFDLFCLVTIDPCLWLFSILDSSLGSPCQRLWAAVVLPLATGLTRLIKRTLLQNLDGVVSFVIVTAGMAAMGIFGTFFAIQCAGEAQEVIGAVQVFFEETTWLAEQTDTKKHFEMLTEEGLRTFGLSPEGFNETNPLRGLAQDLYSSYVVGFGPTNASLYDKERLHSLFNMSTSLQFGDPQYWLNLQELFRESAQATRAVLSKIQKPSLNHSLDYFEGVETTLVDYVSGLEVSDLLTKLDISSLVSKTLGILAGSGQFVW